MSQITTSSLKPKNKITKGHYGYLRQRKRSLLIGAIVLLIGIAGLVTISLVKFHTTKTWLAIAAAVSAIPMAMSFATWITLTKYKEREKEETDRIRALTGKGLLNCDLVVSNTEGAAYHFSYVYVHENGMYAFTANEKTDTKKVSNYVRNFLRLNECDGDFVIFTNLQAFEKRLKSLPPSDRESCDEYLLKQEGVLRSISM